MLMPSSTSRRARRLPSSTTQRGGKPLCTLPHTSFFASSSLSNNNWKAFRNSKDCDWTFVMAGGHKESITTTWASMHDRHLVRGCADHNFLCFIQQNSSKLTDSWLHSASTLELDRPDKRRPKLFLVTCL